MEKKEKKRLSTPLLVLVILLGLALLLCLTVLLVLMHGRSTLQGSRDPAPSLELISQAPTEETAPSKERPDGYTVYHDGKYYRYKEGMVNLLLIGVDSDEKPDAPLPNGNDNQADVIVLAALDTKNDTMTLISVSRDTMCDIAVLDENGNDLGSARAQLALSYSYGDGLETSCELCREAVSNLFGGLNIDGYAAFYMGGISDLNDALGGVTVQVLDDYDFTVHPGCEVMTSGSTVTLTGEQARMYIRCRNDDTTGNDNRMQRQKQYMLAMIAQARQSIAGNPTRVFSLYNALSSYVLTDLSTSSLAYLAAEGASMHFSGDMLRVTGQSVLSDQHHMELMPDPQALYRLILDVFYEEYKG